MRFDSLIPVLDVKDVEASIDFYSTVLGFTTQDKVQWGGKTEWALLRTGRVQLMLCASADSDEDEHVGGSEGVFFVYLENLEDLHTYLGACGYDPQPRSFQVSGKLQNFYLRDPDGYILWFSHRSKVENHSDNVGEEPIIVMKQKVAQTP